MVLLMVLFKKYHRESSIYEGTAYFSMVPIISVLWSPINHQNPQSYWPSGFFVASSGFTG